MDTPHRPARPRDSVATREALLTAARDLFATVGYDGTTVRAVADRAGVNQALLFRYFGNKEGLFGEAILGEAMGLLKATPQAELLPRTLGAILDGDHQGAATLMALLRATGSAQVATEVRAQLVDAFTTAFTPLANTEDAADAAVRVDLLLAWLLGITLYYSMVQTRPAADPEAVIGHARRAAEALLA